MRKVELFFTLWLVIMMLNSKTFASQTPKCVSGNNLQNNIYEFPEVKLQLDNKVPILVVNGKKYTTMNWGHTSFNPKQNSFTEKKLGTVRDSNLHLYMPFVLWEWKGEGKYDFSKFDDVLERIVKIDPEALIIPFFRVDNPYPGGPMSLARDLHPDELVTDESGNKVLETYPNCPAGKSFYLGSEYFKEEGQRVLRALIKHMKAQKYASHVIGLNPCGGTSMEWMYFGCLTNVNFGFSKAARRSWQQWLEKKYSSIGKLNDAWKTKFDSFDMITVPSVKERMEDITKIYNPAKKQKIIDFRQYLSEAVADLIMNFAKTIKDESQRKLLCGIFYGYVTQVLQVEWSEPGHFALGKVLESPDIDFLISPSRYEDRGLGGASGFMTTDSSVSMHGKLWITHADLRTHLADSPGPHSRRDSGGKVYTVEESQAVMKREFANTLVRGAACHWFDFGFGWLTSSPELMSLIGKLRKVEQEYKLIAQNLPAYPESEHSIAVIMDETATYYTPQKNAYNKAFVYKQMPALGRTGVGFDCYLMSDLEKIPDHRVYVFLNALNITPEQTKYIDTKLKKDGKVLVWLGLPGITDTKKVDWRNVGKVTGFKLKKFDEDDSSFITTITGHSHSIDKYMEMPASYGSLELKLSPFLSPQDGLMIGKTTDGKPSLAIKKFDDWTSVYSMSPDLPSSLLRGICDFAGMRIANKNNADVTYYNGRLLSVHTVPGGTRIFNVMPNIKSAEELFGGKKYEVKDGKFTVELEPKSTVLYLLREQEPVNKNTKQDDYIPFTGNARWIWGSDAEWLQNADRTVFPTRYFRREFDAPETAGLKLNVHVSADSRYLLYFNGTLVSRGPAKGDISHYFYDSLDLSSHVLPGKNVIAAVVVNFSAAYPNYKTGQGGPINVITCTHGFVLDGILQDKSGSIITELYSDNRWKTIPDKAFSQIRSNSRPVYTWTCEEMDGRVYPWGWHEKSYDDSEWDNCVEMDIVVRADNDNTLTNYPHRLVPRMIPFLREEFKIFKNVLNVTGLSEELVYEAIVNAKPLSISAGSEVSFVLDAGELTTGFPEIEFAGKTEGTVELTTAEAWTANNQKSFYNDNDGIIDGPIDRYIFSDECELQNYQPLNWRTFRYIKIVIKTLRDITINRIGYIFTTYPASEKASFESSDSSHTELWDISRRTIQLCCHELFEDCPFYEQLQYIGDSLVLMPLLGYFSGDWTLARQAMYHFSWGSRFDGLVECRYPSRIPSYIPSWALLYPYTLWQYWWYTADDITLLDTYVAMQRNIDWFEQYQNSDGLLDSLPYWNFVDWTPRWPMGKPSGAEGRCSVMNFQYIASLRATADIAQLLGKSQDYIRWTEFANKASASLYSLCWNGQAGLYCDSPDYPDSFSELTNAWAILADALMDEAHAETICNSILSEKESITQASFFGRFITMRALSKAACYPTDQNLFRRWKELLKTDLTTWPETAEYTEPLGYRSFCHGWSAGILYEFLAEILGVKPLSAGFGTLLIQPHMMDLDAAEGIVPIPAGDVWVRWERNEQAFNLWAKWPAGVEAEIVLPDGSRRHVISTGDTEKFNNMSRSVNAFERRQFGAMV